MAGNQFVIENQLLVNEVNVEKSELVNHGERSLYSTGEPRKQFFQQKNTGRILFDAKKSAPKDFSVEEIVKYFDCYKCAGNDFTVPEIDVETSRETQQEKLNRSHHSKPLLRSLQELKSEEKPPRCREEILEQNVAEATGEKPAKTDVLTNVTTNYFQGSFQLSPFGVKAMASSQGFGETINFATLVEWSDVLYQKGQKPKADKYLDSVNQKGMTHQQQPRSILRKEKVDKGTKPETKSVHFGFPVVWTKYFTSDDDNESTASTELLFSDEEFEDEVRETEDQEVPRNENLDEPCTKKARTDDGRFVPSFIFPEVMSIPSLDLLRLTDEGKDHTMTEVPIPNGPAEEISIEVDENERKVEKLQNSSSKDRQNHSASVEDNTTKTANDGLDYRTLAQLKYIDLSKDKRQHKDNTESQEKLQFLRKLVTSHHEDDPDYGRSAGEPSCHNQQELTGANSENRPDNVKFAEVSCDELVLANNDECPDYVKFAQVPCHELVQANNDECPDYVKSAEVPCQLLVPVNNDDCPDYVRSAEVPCHELVPANNDKCPDYVRSAEVPCHELVPANNEDSPDYVKSLCEVSYLDKAQNANDLNQHNYTEIQEKPQLLKELVLVTERISDRYGQSDIVPCNDNPPHANNQNQHTDTETPQLLEKLYVVPSANPETTPDNSFSSSPSPSEVSQNPVSDRNGLKESQPVQSEDASLISLMVSFTPEGAQEVPETDNSITCNTVNNYRPAGVCPSLLRLGEECLLDEVDHEPHASPHNILGEPLIDHFLEQEGPSLFQDDRSIVLDLSLCDNDIGQELETPSLSPVRNPLEKTSSFEEEFSSCENDNESCSSQISEITEEFNNLLTMDLSGCEPRTSSPESNAFTNIENQDLGTFPERVKYRTKFLSALEREACGLDGPELLEMAMHLVESAIRKTKCPNRRLGQCPRSSEESKETSLTEVKVMPAFTWKKFSYESQQATLNFDNQVKNESDQGMETRSLNHEKLYYNKSCTRPLRVGLSRRSRNHSLHPYAARPRSGNTMDNKYQEVPDYNSSE